MSKLSISELGVSLQEIVMLSDKVRELNKHYGQMIKYVEEAVCKIIKELRPEVSLWDVNVDYYGEVPELHIEILHGLVLSQEIRSILEGAIREVVHAAQAGVSGHLRFEWVPADSRGYFSRGDNQ